MEVSLEQRCPKGLKNAKKLNEANIRCFIITIFLGCSVFDPSTRSSVKKQGQNGRKRDKKTNKRLWVSDICWRNGLRDFAKKSHIFLLYKSVYFRYYAMLSRHSNYMTLKCLIDAYRLGYLCPNAYRQPSSDESTSCRHVSSDKGWQYS